MEGLEKNGTFILTELELPLSKKVGCKTIYAVPWCWLSWNFFITQPHIQKTKAPLFKDRSRHQSRKPSSNPRWLPLMNSTQYASFKLIMLRYGYKSGHGNQGHDCALLGIRDMDTATLFLTWNFVLYLRMCLCSGISKSSVLKYHKKSAWNPLRSFFLCWVWSSSAKKNPKKIIFNKEKPQKDHLHQRKVPKKR